MAEKDYNQSIAIFRQAIRKNPTDTDGFDSLAWQLATCPTKSICHGQEAVDVATRACNATKWANYNFIDTLAAACAECGSVGAAVQYEEKAIALLKAGGTGNFLEFEERLAIYRQGKAYHRESASTN